MIIEKSKLWLTGLLSGCLLLAGTPSYGLDRVRLATQLWPPYQTLDDGVMGGIALERVQCTFRRMQQPYELNMMRWDKAQLLVETGKMDGFFAGSKNSARARYATMSEAVISEDLSWYFNPGVNLNANDESSKYKARFGAKFNTSKWLFLKKNGYNVIKKPRDAEALLKMLWQGEIDVALEYELVFEHYMKQLGIPTDYFRRVPIRTQDLNVHFSKNFLKENPGFLDRFNQALRRCKQG
ncbi:substrate-binding periplasmic protein [Oceanospirillum beijerinckii]|uniref:substrate-binding periplasmic protein n=1 Tax=Oceanospirillum beijerinckii TaxID=64976 RepID=UPI000400C699|nr:transporter substrate-binding domain-containing protein [Oceanospirillum beijerinckii]